MLQFFLKQIIGSPRVRQLHVIIPCRSEYHLTNIKAKGKQNKCHRSNEKNAEKAALQRCP